MNDPLSFASLRNSYFALRHGESIANVEGIIVSKPQSGCLPKYGLSEKGRLQVAETARLWGPVLSTDLLIYSSDFSRARETAEIIGREINAEILERIELRERFFGQLEGKSSQSYDVIWTQDAIDPTHSNFNVESVFQVQTRTTRLIAELEQKHSEKKILLVSHGDTLQILEAIFLDLNPAEHRSIPLLQNAEIRLLNTIID